MYEAFIVAFADFILHIKDETCIIMLFLQAGKFSLKLSDLPIRFHNFSSYGVEVLTQSVIQMQSVQLNELSIVFV